MASVEKFIRLHKSLMTVSHRQGFIDFPRLTKLKRIAKACAETLNVSRASIWELDESEQCIKCEVLYILAEDRFYYGAELHEKDFPGYFKAISESRLINADNAITDPRTSEFSDSYLIPNSICSMLDAPVFLEGKLRGVVCLEQTEDPRIWDMAEMSFVASLADHISMINEYERWLKGKEQLEFLERYDALTGLEKRNNFQQRLDIDISDESRSSRRRALVLLGIDSFGAFNEKFGHQTADKLLIVMARQLLALSHDFHYQVSRIEGDTFALWISDLNEVEMLNKLLAELDAISCIDFRISDEEKVSVGFSTGVVIYPTEEELPFGPLRCAEIAMQKAKHSSRGGVEYFSAQWLTELQSRRVLEKEFVEAISQNQLVPYYQPIYSQGGNQIIGLEALVRWIHPERGVVSPAEFLPVAKRMGLMKQLGSFMLSTASRDISALKKMGSTIRWVSVNISSEQLYDPELAKEIEQILQENSLPPSAIELEIIEELISQDSSLVRSQLSALSELEVRLAIDDFGTGYSSLSRLKNMPVTKLKIDKSFVDGLPSSEDDCCIVQSIVGLAKGLQIELVAEGVEHQAQLDFLSDLGCHLFQGYLLSKPQPFDAIKKLLEL